MVVDRSHIDRATVCYAVRVELSVFVVGQRLVGSVIGLTFCLCCLVLYFYVYSVPCLLFLVLHVPCSLSAPVVSHSCSLY